jgi:SAM-dependent methyltransferase
MTTPRSASHFAGAPRTRLNDPAVVRAEYATAERIHSRRLDRWGEIEGDDPYELAFAALAEAAPSRVLDAGCGPGVVAKHLVERLRCDVVAVDLSPAMADAARQAGFEAHVADLQALPFAEASFDAALAMNVLYHVPDVEAAVSELARVLVPGGRLVAGTHFADHMLEVWGGDDSIAFSAENGEALLRRSFARAERREARGSVVFPDAQALRGYLAGFETLHGRDETGRAEGFEFPLRSRRHNAVFVAETAA